MLPDLGLIMKCGRFRALPRRRRRADSVAMRPVRPKRASILRFATRTRAGRSISCVSGARRGAAPVAC